MTVDNHANNTLLSGESVKHGEWERVMQNWFVSRFAVTLNVEVKNTIRKTLLEHGMHLIFWLLV